MGFFVPLVAKQGIQVCVWGFSTPLQSAQTCFKNSSMLCLRNCSSSKCSKDLIQMTLFPTVSNATCFKWKRETWVSAPSAVAQLTLMLCRQRIEGWKVTAALEELAWGCLTTSWLKSQPSFYCLPRRTSLFYNVVAAAVDTRCDKNKRNTQQCHILR